MDVVEIVFLVMNALYDVWLVIDTTTEYTEVRVDKDRLGGAPGKQPW